MIIKSLKLNIKYISFVSFFLCLILLGTFIFTKCASLAGNTKEKNEYIKWVNCNATYKLLSETSKVDIESHNSNGTIKFNWIELIAYLSSKYYGHLENYKTSDLNEIVSRIKNGENFKEITDKMNNYDYYFECYDAIFHEYIGEYFIENKDSNGKITYEKKYGLKAFLPIAGGFSFSHYDDFGNSRSYGYKRVHLGNDLMGNIGTPIIAVESGVVEAAGWNQYGGWRIGIRSFDGKRYYYYAHLRKDHPFAEDIYVGKVITAGDVIGYLGMTGYSQKENVNNINVPHLHFGIQLIFNEVQKEGTNQIWIDVYHIIEFLKQNKSNVYLNNKETYDYSRKITILENSVYD